MSYSLKDIQDRLDSYPITDDYQSGVFACMKELCKHYHSFILLDEEQNALLTILLLNELTNLLKNHT